MKNLQQHQLRVASVAKLICDNFEQNLEKEDIIQASLLHDMGNIIKFDLTKFPEFLEPEGLNYWKNVQDEFKIKYGENEHLANLKIAQELKVSEKIIELIDSVGFKKAESNLKSGNFSKMIVGYADTRVAPFGVVSMKERLEEGKQRYKTKYFNDKDDKVYKRLLNVLQISEWKIFNRCKIKPEDINDLVIKDNFSLLKNYNF